MHENDNTRNQEQRQIARRTIVKGAAWSVPAVAAAVAMPLASASNNPPECPTCLKAGALLAIGQVSTNAWIADSVVAGGVRAIQLTAATQLDARDCDLGLIFDLAYDIIGFNAKLTTLNTDTNTTQTWESGFVSLSGGVGTFGELSALASTFTFPGVTLPDGGSIGVGGVQLVPYPIKLTKLEIIPTLELDVLVTQQVLQCQPTITYNLNTTASLGVIVAGIGTINWAGTGLPA